MCYLMYNYSVFLSLLTSQLSICDQFSGNNVLLRASQEVLSSLSMLEQMGCGPRATRARARGIVAQGVWGIKAYV